MWDSIAEFHAAVNDFPPALLIASVAFYVAGKLTKRESLTHAGYWSLVGAAVGSVLAVVSGLRAEGVIEHGSVMHRSIERHETLAIAFTVLVVGLAAWRTVRRGLPGRKEGIAYGAGMAAAVLGVFWVSSVGGRILFRHAGGIETTVLQSAIAERAAGHEHEEGEADHEHPAGTPEHEHPSEAEAAAEHEHPPGTPPHEHDDPAGTDATTADTTGGVR